MHITQIDVLQIQTVSPGWRPVLCRIYTDSGIYGDGEACLAFGKGSSAVFGMLKDLAAMVIGMNPVKTETIWQKLYQNSTWKGFIRLNMGTHPDIVKKAVENIKENLRKRNA